MMMPMRLARFFVAEPNTWPHLQSSWQGVQHTGRLPSIEMHSCTAALAWKKAARGAILAARSDFICIAALLRAVHKQGHVNSTRECQCSTVHH
jgi:hypothetical protein